MTKEELLNKICVILGGRAAEKLVFDHLSTGAADDLVRATDIARAIVARYGMDERLGSIAYDVERSPFLQPAPGQFTFERIYSEDTAREIDLAVRRIVDQQFERALSILSRNREILERCAQELLQAETLDEAALKRLTAGLERESERQRAAA